MGWMGVKDGEQAVWEFKTFDTVAVFRWYQVVTYKFDMGFDLLDTRDLMIQ
jgi:hypothetical protein